MIMLFVLRGRGEMAQWCRGVEYTPAHSRVAQCGIVCGRLLSPQTSQQNRSSTHLTHRRRHGDVPQMWLSQRNGHTEHELRKGDLKDILVVISKNTRQAEFGWNENNSEEVGHAWWIGWKSCAFYLSQSHVSCHAKWLRLFMVTYADLAKFCMFFGFCLLIYRMT